MHELLIFEIAVYNTYRRWSVEFRLLSYEFETGESKTDRIRNSLDIQTEWLE